MRSLRWAASPAGSTRKPLTRQSFFVVIAGFLANTARHEAHLPTFQNSPCAHAWLPRAHENAWGARGDQRAPGQGPQAAGSVRSPAGSAGRPAHRARLPITSSCSAMQRLVNKADFERLLSVRPWRRSAHFALHHVCGVPLARITCGARAGSQPLSTDDAPTTAESVDNSPASVWFGTLVPKRHARRAVTRNLLKRQAKAAFERHAALLPPGLFLLRLRTPFAREVFRSAASPALAMAARTELDRLLAGADA